MLIQVITAIWNVFAGALSGRISLGDTIRWLILYLSTFQYDILIHESLVKDAKTFQDEYDFIIVGTGTAGSVMANRLSEIESWNTLALEAGGNENLISEIPALQPYLMGSSLDWQYKTTPTPNPQYCMAMNDAKCNVARGKILGGSSAINGMVYMRGNKKDYDHWHNLGNAGWSYSDVLPYFLKSEDNRNAQYLAETPTYHSSGGYLTVEEAPYKTGLADLFVGALQEKGYANRDLNGAEQAGVMYNQGTMKNGARMSAARAFLRPIKNRPNLHVSMNSHVTKILIDPDTKDVYGVTFVKDGVERTIKAKKEVILSAGAIASPQLLMLSGIGIKTHLESLNIPVIKDLKVGNNLQDHVGIPLQFTYNGTTSTVPTFQDLWQYHTSHNGPLSMLASECSAFTYTKYENQSLLRPDIEMHFLPFGFNQDKEQTLRVTNMRTDFYDQTVGSIGSQSDFMILPYILRPKSRGTIRLKSADPFDYPAIVPHYLQNENDMKRLISGIRTAIRLVNTNSFRSVNAQYHQGVVPGCRALTYDTKDYWTCVIMEATTSLWHFAGTCKMGPKEDKTAVVSRKLSVRGVKGLRIVDASIMPTVVSANLQATVIMIAEKAADLVKTHWNQ